MAVMKEADADMAAIAASLSEGAIRKIAAEPKNYAAHKIVLENLNSVLTLRCLEEFFPDNRQLADIAPVLGRELPEFSRDTLYEKRQNLAAMAGMTLLGWLLGGAASGVLSLLGMGGDILRVAGVFVMFWLSEYLSASPGARKAVLAFLGFSGLMRFAAAALTGFTGSAGIRRAIFGAGRLPGLFMRSWLVFGSFFVFVFMAKKIDGLNIAAFRESLEKQVFERLKLANFVFSEAGKSVCKKVDSAAIDLAGEIAGMLDGLPAEKSGHLRQALRQAGFEMPGESSWLVWDEARDREFYETVGMVKNGDRCLVLTRPLIGPGTIRRGRAQRVNE